MMPHRIPWQCHRGAQSLCYAHRQVAMNLYYVFATVTRLLGSRGYMSLG
jgi:hypothetical protein